MTYIIRFATTADRDRFLEEKFPGEVVKIHTHRPRVTVKVNRKDYQAFFDALKGLNVREFEEKPFTLQDYFMSFYKEEKSFGGLSGVEGNKK